MPVISLFLILQSFNMNNGRRKFLRHATGIAAGIGLTSIPGSSLAFAFTKRSANETINVGLIGCRGMGWANLSSMLTNANVSCMAVCDVDSNVLQSRAVGESGDLMSMVEGRVNTKDLLSELGTN